MKRPHYLPDRPGVYLIKDRSGKIIYVGKAKRLRKRIASHFRPGSKVSPHIHDVDYIVTSNELEALILEATLIKKHKPRYNVLLRDDKQYPYLKLTVNEEWPRLVMVRKTAEDGARYFGPYMSQTVRDIINVIKRLFQIRWCKEFRKRPQQCFYYHMRKCPGPCLLAGTACAGETSKEDYMKNVKDIELFLDGKYGTAIKKLKNEMKEASEGREYEKAARLRDKLRMFEKIFEEQKVVSSDRADRDVFHVSVVGGYALVLILEIRGGKLTAKESYLIREIDRKEEGNILPTLVVQYYSASTYIPDEVIVDAGKEAPMLARALTSLKKSKVSVVEPASGDAKGLYGMAAENSKFIMEQRLKKEKLVADSLFDLQKMLGLVKVPYRVEAFDISTTMGVETVGSMVVFEGGEPFKSDYRKFRVGHVNNDQAAMRNVVMRRYTGALSRELAVPDLILVDGGKPQLNAAKNFVPKGASIAALAKKLEEVYLPGRKLPLRLNKNIPALKLLRRIRDEAHRFAVTFHRKRRTSHMLGRTG